MSWPKKMSVQLRHRGPLVDRKTKEIYSASLEEINELTSEIQACGRGQA